MKTKEERLLSAVDVGQILNCSKRSVFRYAYDKIPAPVHLGGSTKWKSSDINLFLECNCDMEQYKTMKQSGE